MSDNVSKEQIDLPLLPLRDVVVFPHMVIPLFVGRPKSIKALETSMESGKSILLVAQKTAAQDDPTPEDLYDTGSVATVLQMLKLPDGTVKVLVEGNQRARVLDVTDVVPILLRVLKFCRPRAKNWLKWRPCAVRC